MAPPRSNPHVLDIGELPARLSRLSRLIGLDVGTKTIGVALSDVERRLAAPLKTVRRTSFSNDARALVELVATHDAAAIVVGLPFNMNGSEGPRAQSVRAFVRNLSPLMEIPFVYWDERLSTAAVARSLIEQDASRARRAAVIDRMAAAYILQGALDRLTGLMRAQRG